MKIRILVFAFLCALPLSRVAAQFSMPEVAPQSAGFLNPFDSIRMTDYRNDYFSMAKWKAERLARRKERNTLEISATLQMSQTQFENWASGGDNTFSGRSTLFFRHCYKVEKFSVESKFDARYGLNYIEKKQFKNEDEFKATLLFGWNISDSWSCATSGELRSQFSTGYESRDSDVRVSTFMAPGFLMLQAGFKYRVDGLTVLLSPVSGSATFMLDDELMMKGLNGVDPGARSKWQVGPSVNVNYDKEFYKKVFRYRSQFQTFSNIKTPPTVRWENTFDIRATKFFTTTFYWLVAYDKYASTPRPDALQFKYSIAAGLAYTFRNKPLPKK